MATSNPSSPRQDKSSARRSSTFGATIAADLLRAPTTAATQVDRASGVATGSARNPGVAKLAFTNDAAASTKKEDDSNKERVSKESYVRELSRASNEGPGVVRLPSAPGFRVPLPGAFGEAASTPATRSDSSWLESLTEVNGTKPARGEAEPEVLASPEARADRGEVDERDAIYPERVHADDTNDPFSEPPAALAAGLLSGDRNPQPEPANDRTLEFDEDPYRSAGEPQPSSKRETSAKDIASDALNVTPPRARPIDELEDPDGSFASLLEPASDSAPLADGRDLSHEPLIEPLAAPPAITASAGTTLPATPPKRYGPATLIAVFVAVCGCVLLLGQLWTGASTVSGATPAIAAVDDVAEPAFPSEHGSLEPTLTGPNSYPNAAGLTQAVRFEDLPSDDNNERAITTTSLDEETAQESAKQESAPPATSPPAPGTRGTLAVNSIPASTVFIDGRRVGHTPQLALSISAGAHEVKLEHPRHGTHRQIVTIEADEKQVLSHRF